MRSIRGGTGVEVTLTGSVTAQEIVEASHAIYDVVPLQSQELQLWDYTGVTKLVATNEEIWAVATVDNTYAVRRTDPLYVLSVQPTDLGFGIGRMYEVFAASSNWITIHFRKREEADHWMDRNLAPRQGDATPE
jgi:hypothetical protein